MRLFSPGSGTLLLCSELRISKQLSASSYVLSIFESKAWIHDAKPQLKSSPFALTPAKMEAIDLTGWVALPDLNTSRPKKQDGQSCPMELAQHQFFRTLLYAERQSIFSSWYSKIKAYKEASRLFRGESIWEAAREFGTAKLRSSKSLKDSNPLHRRCARVLSRLNEELLVPKNWGLRVCPNLNSLALALAVDQCIMIDANLVKHCITDDMLAFVLAHELSHLIAKHNNKTRAIEKHYHLRFILAHLICSILIPSRFWRGKPKVDRLYYKLLNAMKKRRLHNVRRINRKHEYEADTFAFDLMERAGYDTEGAVHFQQLMIKLYPEEKQEDYNMRTHPLVCGFQISRAASSC